MIENNFMIDDNSCTFYCCLSCDMILHRMDRDPGWTILGPVVPIRLF